MRWWSAIFGGFLLLFAVAFASGLRGRWHVTTTDPRGNVTEEYRPLRPLERLSMAAISLVAGAFGVLLLAGAVPWTAERVPEERLLPVLGVGLVTAVFAWGAAIAWIHAWRARGDADHGGAQVESDPEDSPDDALMGLVSQALLSHPVGAVILGAVCAALAVFAASQVVPVWQGDDHRLGAVMQWLQPISALGNLVGLSEVVVALILLGIWLVIALSTRNALGAVFTVLLMGVYGLVALVLWPFGLVDEWLSFGRSILSLL